MLKSVACQKNTATDRVANSCHSNNTTCNTRSIGKRDTDVVSGRYWANISDTLLVGEFHQWKNGELAAAVHKSGSF